MRWLLGALLALIAAVSLALIARQDPGYVLIAHGDWSIEGSLVLLVIAILVAYALLSALLKLIHLLRTTPGALLGWGRGRHGELARKRTQRGLIALAEGEWKRAEKDLSRAARHSDTPLINYLGAARAAQKRDAEDRRDDYLSRAARSMPEARLAVGLTQAEVQISSNQLEQALATLENLRDSAPKHGLVLDLLRRLYDKLGAWEELLKVLPELRRQQLLSEKEHTTLERRCYDRLLEKAQDTATLEALWAQLPKPMRREPTLLADYCRHRHALDGGSGCAELLREAIRREWDEELVRLYGLIEDGDPARLHDQAESWLKSYPQQPALYLALARQAMRAELWGKARHHLEDALARRDDAETHCELGRLLQRLDEPDKAAEHFRLGLNQAVGGRCLKSIKKG